MTENTTPEALPIALAMFFESMQKSSHRWHDDTPVHEKTAAELRRLYEVEQEAQRLRARAQALEDVLKSLINGNGETTHSGLIDFMVSESDVKRAEALLR